MDLSLSKILKCMPLLYYQVSTLQDKEKQQEVPCGEEQE
jgi:hypothetical protein